MEQTHYLISDAAKLVEVESHVLRYWEEELEIPIKRNVVKRQEAENSEEGRPLGLDWAASMVASAAVDTF